MNIIISDEWLSRIVGKPVYELKSFEINLKLNDLPKGQVLIWSKIPVDNIDKLICLQKLGFYIVDTNIKFILSDKISSKNKFNLRFANSGDETDVRTLARSAFNYNRFNQDPNISNKIASKIKEEWVGNFFLGKRGKWMIIIEDNSKIAGFLQLISKNQNTIVIDLIAIDEKNRGKGLAKEMISYAYENCLKKNGTIEVGTQISNAPSIKLYSNLGFNMNTASYVLHMHK